MIIVKTTHWIDWLPIIIILSQRNQLLDGMRGRGGRRKLKTWRSVNQKEVSGSLYDSVNVIYIKKEKSWRSPDGMPLWSSSSTADQFFPRRHSSPSLLQTQAGQAAASDDKHYKSYSCLSISCDDSVTMWWWWWRCCTPDRRRWKEPHKRSQPLGRYQAQPSIFSRSYVNIFKDLV